MGRKAEKQNAQVKKIEAGEKKADDVTASMK